PVSVTADTSRLSAGDKQALPKLLEAAQVINDIFQVQLWSGNPELKAKLSQDSTPLGKARYHYFLLNNGPWADLDAHTAFIPGVPDMKLPGANFYPRDMTKQEFEAWESKLPKAQQEEATGFFSVIHRGKDEKLSAVPYSVEYKAQLTRAAKLLD